MEFSTRNHVESFLLSGESKLGFSKYTTSEEVKPVTPEQNEKIAKIVKEGGHRSAETLTPDEKEQVREVLDN